MVVSQPSQFEQSLEVIGHPIQLESAPHTKHSPSGRVFSHSNSITNKVGIQDWFCNELKPILNKNFTGLQGPSTKKWGSLLYRRLSRDSFGKIWTNEGLLYNHGDAAVIRAMSGNRGGRRRDLRADVTSSLNLGGNNSFSILSLSS
ncbi:Uncharacterized protein Fot_28547 [Forsythia ovata]|uniref:Uncharacterized protein n=1 Tax=Forsythia ovata TaxID=205694 RepID=A0ABD1TPA4_9LAMI